MHALTCLVPLLSLAWDGQAPLDKTTADQLRASLSPRELQSALLSPQDQKKYEAALATAHQPQQSRHAGTDKLQAARQYFKEASIQLQFKQESKALNAEREGLHALLDRWDAKPRWPASDLAVLQAHFEPFAKLVEKDPQLVLTLLHDLDDQYTLIAAKLKQRKADSRSMEPVANLWLQLSKADKLSQADWDIALSWASLLRAESFPNRKLTEAERTQYQLELNGLRINYQQSVLAEPDRLRATRAGTAQIEAAQERRDVLVPANPDRLRTQQYQTANERYGALMQADIQFVESQLHLKYGQEQKALSAFAEGIADLNKADKAPKDAFQSVQNHGTTVANLIADREPLLTQPIKKLLWASVPKPPCSAQKPEKSLSLSKF